MERQVWKRVTKREDTYLDATEVEEYKKRDTVLKITMVGFIGVSHKEL
jgi:hypothetical protein